MVLDWIRARGARPRAVAAVQARISDALWTQTMASYPFFAAMRPEEHEALRARSAWVLASKTFNGAGGLVLDDTIQLAIAAQAALPILNLNPSLYDGWEEIIVYPSGFLVPRSHQDEAGVVHEFVESASGEAWEGGPLVLSWEDARAQASAYNVVIHEFAHKLDLNTGEATGMPALHHHKEIEPRRWLRVLDDSLARFRAALDSVEAAIPSTVDPDSDAADEWYHRLPLDPYAATDEAEFFAVSSEHFFADPAPMAEALPAWFALLCAYYRQDPLTRIMARLA